MKTIRFLDFPLKPPRQAVGEFYGLTFSSSNSLPANVNAQTSNPNNFMITITFNENNLNRPALSIARTLIHEMIHAEMYRKLLSLAQQGEIPRSEQFIESIENDYPGLYDYYMRYYYDMPARIPLGDPQHQLMAQHYKDIIIDALNQFDNNQHTQSLYEAIAWTGLMVMEDQI